METKIGISTFEQMFDPERFHQEREKALLRAISRNRLEFLIRGLDSTRPTVYLIDSTTKQPFVICSDFDDRLTVGEASDLQKTPYEMLITEKRAQGEEERIKQISKYIPMFLRDLGFKKTPPIYVYGSTEGLKLNQPSIKIESTRRGRRPKPIVV